MLPVDPGTLPDMSLGIYVHIPFCQSRCNYCHFITGAFSEETAGRYAAALRREIESSGREEAQPEAVDSIYFGGGTPSLVSAGLIEGVISTMRDVFTVAGDCEISLEANPETITARKAEEYLRIGINRISLGVQSFVDSELKAIERIHAAEASSRSLRVLRDAGFANLNLDLILGLPGQTAESWRFSIARTVEALLSHVSVYMLDLDDARAPLHHAVAAGKLSLPDDDEQADWYLETIDILQRNGIAQYEISNFAAAGMECRHNLKYWKREPVFGFGVGSHSYDGRMRYANVSSLNRYLDLAGAGSSPVDWRYPVDETSGIEESFFLGLRLNHGVDLEFMKRRFDPGKLDSIESTLEGMLESGLVERDGGFVRLTSRGRLLANEVFSALLQ
jgi:oxygen-independent coproporphyrinogen-3 oxidase